MKNLKYCMVIVAFMSTAYGQNWMVMLSTGEKFADVTFVRIDENVVYIQRNEDGETKTTPIPVEDIDRIEVIRPAAYFCIPLGCIAGFYLGWIISGILFEGPWSLHVGCFVTNYGSIVGAGLATYLIYQRYIIDHNFSKMTIDERVKTIQEIIDMAG